MVNRNLKELLRDIFARNAGERSYYDYACLHSALNNSGLIRPFTGHFADIARGLRTLAAETPDLEVAALAVVLESSLPQP